MKLFGFKMKKTYALDIYILHKLTIVLKFLNKL